MKFTRLSSANVQIRFPAMRKKSALHRPQVNRHLTMSGFFCSPSDVRVGSQFKEDCMNQTKSLRRCSVAVALAAALLTWPAAGYAQLPLPTTSSTIVGDAT